MKGKIKFKMGRIGKTLYTRLYNLFKNTFDVNPGEYIGIVNRDELRYLCINDLCIIHSIIAGAGEFGTNTIYQGQWVATIVKGEITPSIPLVKKIYSSKGFRAAVLVGEKGVKAFLYGNDVLLESIIEKYEPVDGLVSIVDSSDNEIIGFAKWNPRKKVFENIYDLGIYLRILG